MTLVPLIHRFQHQFSTLGMVKQIKRSMVFQEQFDDSMNRVEKRIRFNMWKLSISDDSVNLISPSTKFFWAKLISLWMPIVVATNLLVTIEAKRNSILWVV